MVGCHGRGEGVVRSTGRRYVVGYKQGYDVTSSQIKVFVELY
jgi:hypothetical protein